MNKIEEAKKSTLVQAWEDRDEAENLTQAEGPKLCKIENPDCEACQ